MSSDFYTLDDTVIITETIEYKREVPRDVYEIEMSLYSLNAEETAKVQKYINKLIIKKGIKPLYPQKNWCKRADSNRLPTS